MKNCFFCTRTDCPQVGIDGMWGDACAMDDAYGIVISPYEDEESDDETEDDQ